ncbi:MAG TPA: hypothetical protein VJQ59_16705 [Candidatus Sulfotelmatobacter sp.]|nr:hypothetical protein [Candidatus Sulfotelmatobacter sp.]
MPTFGSYAYITFGNAKAELAALLDDSGNVYWSDAELGIYIIESIRTFGGLSRFFRARGAFSLTSGAPFYDLSAEIPALRGYNVTDEDLIKAMEYHLLEPPTPTSWTGTDQFTLSDLSDALTRRTNQFLLDTSCVMSSSQIATGVVPSGRFALADTTTIVRQVNFQPTGGDWVSLWAEDNWSIDAANNSIQSPGTPEVYSLSETPKLTVRLSPAPNLPGTMELVTVECPAQFTPPSGAAMNVPDDYTWAIKFGALADLFGRDGQARDPMRAQYCEQRYQEGVIAARIAASYLDGQIGNAPLWIDSYVSMQAAIPTWRAAPGTPQIAAALGLNLVAFGPVPDASYGVSFDVVSNATVPSADGDFIQVGREELDVILRYARHLAALKMGGTEFVATFDGWQSMVKLASQMNSQLRAYAKDLWAMRDRAQLDRMFKPEFFPTPEKEMEMAQ